MGNKSEENQTGQKQSIEELQARYQKLDKRKTQAETNLENATDQPNSLKQEAREKYGTDDVVALREKLTTMTAENEEKRSKYQADLDRIEAELGAVEQKFAPAETPSEIEEPQI